MGRVSTDDPSSADDPTTADDAVDASSDPADADTSTDREAAVAETPARAGRRLFWFTLAVGAFVVLVDQGTKLWAETALADGRTIPVIGDLIRFVLVYNPGAAFSIGTEFTWVLAVLAAAAVVGIAWFAWSVRSVGWMVALGLVLGGAATHLADRLFRDPGFGRGHVVDFIGYGNLFVGNVADIAIFSGAVLILLLTLRGVGTGRTASAS